MQSIVVGQCYELLFVS